MNNKDTPPSWHPQRTHLKSVKPIENSKQVEAAGRWLVQEVAVANWGNYAFSPNRNHGEVVMSSYTSLPGQPLPECLWVVVWIDPYLG